MGLPQPIKDMAQRLARLESEVAELKKQQEKKKPGRPPKDRECLNTDKS